MTIQFSPLNSEITERPLSIKERNDILTSNNFDGWYSSKCTLFVSTQEKQFPSAKSFARQVYNSVKDLATQVDFDLNEKPRFPNVSIGLVNQKDIIVIYRSFDAHSMTPLRTE